MKLVLAVSTYNREAYLRKLITSFLENRDPGHEWRLIVVDDGSTDGTRRYLEDLKKEGVQIELIYTHRRGVHHSKNQALKAIRDTEFDIAFLADDDIWFKKPGWAKLYADAMNQTGFKHMVFYHPGHRPNSKYVPIEQGNLINWNHSHFIQGCFLTITPEVIRDVGYWDCINFGLGLGGHVDYTIRCCRAGYNCEETPWDVVGALDYIDMHVGEHEYKPSIPWEERQAREGEELKMQTKQRCLRDPLRVYIPYNETNDRWDIDTGHPSARGSEPKPQPIPDITHHQHAAHKAAERVTKLNIGCGTNVKPGYANLDQYEQGKGIIHCDVEKLPYADGSQDEVLAEDILEHFSRNKWRSVLKEWMRVLKPGGKFIVRVPDMKQLASELKESNEDPIAWEKWNRRIFGDQGREGMTHYTGFAHPYFQKVLETEYNLQYVEHLQQNYNLTYIMVKK